MSSSESSSIERRLWRIAVEPEGLARYVQPDAVRRLVPLAGRAVADVVGRVRAAYDAIAARQVRYALEPTTLEPGAQAIRSPDEVLWRPGHATCLDLALVLAGACRVADIPVWIVIVERDDTQRGRHALVAVPTGPIDTSDEVVISEVPDGLMDEVRERFDEPGSLLLIDPVGMCAADPREPIRGLAAQFHDAVASGARHLTEGAWRWVLGVNITRAHADAGTPPSPFETAGSVDPLREPYVDLTEDVGPLRQLRAEYRVVDFQARDEMTVLRDLCADAEADGVPRVVVVQGVGGAGKTRLACELADRVAVDGWYTGFLKEEADIQWLSRVVSPLLVVVDYADARTADVKRLIELVYARAGLPAVVLLTARAISGWWTDDVLGDLERDGIAPRVSIWRLPDHHPNAAGLFRRAVVSLQSRLNRSERLDLPAPATNVVWTTLDLLLLAWFATESGDLPATRRDLYAEVLRHEVRYWSDVAEEISGGRKTSIDILRTAGAALTLYSPLRSEADAVLALVPSLASDHRWRDEIRQALERCLGSGPSERLAVRPDPVGDELVLTELTHDDAVLIGGNAFDEEARARALVCLNRAAANDYQRAVALITRATLERGDGWELAADLAATQGGAALTALEELVERQADQLPLDELNVRLDYRAVHLRHLGQLVAQARLDRSRTARSGEADIAALLNDLSVRQSDNGDRQGALASITEAVDHYRQLAAARPEVFLPNLATSLNNLSNQQSDNGDRQGAFASMVRARR